MQFELTKTEDKKLLIYWKTSPYKGLRSKEEKKEEGRKEEEIMTALCHEKKIFHKRLYHNEASTSTVAKEREREKQMNVY